MGLESEPEPEPEPEPEREREPEPEPELARRNTMDMSIAVRQELDVDEVEKMLHDDGEVTKSEPEQTKPQKPELAPPPSREATDEDDSNTEHAESKSFVVGLTKLWKDARDDVTPALKRHGTKLACAVLLQAVCAVGIATRGPGVDWLGWIVNPVVFSAVGGLGVFGSLLFLQNDRRDLIVGVVAAALLALASLFELNGSWLGGFNAGCACAVVGFVLTSRMERGALTTELFVLLVAWFVGSVLTVLPAAVFDTVDKGTTDGGATLGALGVFIFTFVLWMLGWAFLWYEAPNMQHIKPKQWLVNMPADNLVRLKVCLPRAPSWPRPSFLF